MMKLSCVDYLSPKKLSSTLAAISVAVLPGSYTYASVSSITDLNADGYVHTIYGARDITFRVPHDVLDNHTELRVKLQGADGGTGYNCDHDFDGIKKNCAFGEGGRGASVIVLYTLGYGENDIQPGSVLRLATGGHGHKRTHKVGIWNTAGGGGGGSAVHYTAPGQTLTQDNYELLIAAGGGGGGFANGGVDLRTSHGLPGNFDTTRGSDGLGHESGTGGSEGANGQDKGKGGGGRGINAQFLGGSASDSFYTRGGWA